MTPDRTKKAFVRKHKDSYWKVLADKLRLSNNTPPPGIPAHWIPAGGGPVPGQGGFPNFELPPGGFPGGPGGFPGGQGGFQGGGNGPGAGPGGFPGGFPDGQGSAPNSPGGFAGPPGFQGGGVFGAGGGFNPNDPPSVNSASAGSFQDQAFPLPNNPGPGLGAAPFGNQNCPSIPAFGAPVNQLGLPGQIGPMPMSNDRSLRSFLESGEWAAHMKQGGQTGMGERIRGVPSGYIGSGMHGGRGVGGVGSVPGLGMSGRSGRSEDGHPWNVETARYQAEETRPRRG